MAKDENSVIDYIQTLNGQVKYPYTLDKAVIMEDGTTLDKKIETIGGVDVEVVGTTLKFIGGGSGGSGGLFKKGALIFDDYVSRGNQYLYPNVLVTPLTYDYFVAYVYVDGTLYTSLDIKLHTDHVELSLDSHLGKRTLHIHVYPQRVTNVQYAGDWKDIKVALYGVEKNEER